MKSLNTVRAVRAPPAYAAPGLEAARLGDDLKLVFGEVTAAPMPDRMLQLADALEEAFRRGDLFESDRGGLV